MPPKNETSFKKPLINIDFLYPCLLVVIIFAVYSVSINYPFLESFDDYKYVVNNPNLPFSISNVLILIQKPYFCMYTPLTMLSYMFDYSLWGLNSGGFHIQNIIWHIIATIAIYKCFRLFNIYAFVAFLMCLVFTTHPQRVESVIWISERKDVVCTAFYFISLFFYIKGYKSNSKFYILSLILYICALLSKPMAVSLPFVLFFYQFQKERTYKIKPYVKQLWPYFVVLLLFFPLTIYSQSIDNNRFNLGRQLYLIIYNYKFYIETTMLPNNLVPVYPQIKIASTVVSTIIFYLSTIFIFSYAYLKNKLFFSFILIPITCSYIITLLPIIGIVPFGSFEQADRWSYIPSVFIWFSLGLILTKLFNSIPNSLTFNKLFKNSLLYSLLLLYALILITLNCQYQKQWKNNYILFLYTFNNTNPSNNLLCALADLALNCEDYITTSKVVKALKNNNEKSSLADFYQACIYSKSNKISSIKLLLQNKDLFKENANASKHYERFYIKTLILLINLYNDSSNINSARKYQLELNKYIQQTNKQPRL